MERDHFEDLCIDGRIILKIIFNRSDGEAELLAEDRDTWRLLVNWAMNLRVP
jgi:hypothetical protein